MNRQLMTRTTMLPRTRLFDPFDLDAVFDEFLGLGRNPRSQMVRVEGGYALEIEAPGMKKQDFKIDIDRDAIAVSAHVEKRSEHEFYRRSFEKSWRLPSGTDIGRVEARYEDGILRIDLPVKDGPLQTATTIPIK
jgi:HSP20 family protein